MTIAERRARVAELRAEGLPLARIATELGCARSVVYVDVHALGLPVGIGRSPVPDRAVAERLRLALARQRAAGAAFDAAWALAVADVGDRGWRSALVATRPAWQRAYARTAPVGAERALGWFS